MNGLPPPGLPPGGGGGVGGGGGGVPGSNNTSNATTSNGGQHRPSAQQQQQPSPAQPSHPRYGQIRAYGSTTSVPNGDYSRLSYYLKCCIIGCGIDFVFDVSLLDYQNSDNLDDDGKERIFKLANEVFRAEVLLNRVIFLDDDHILMPQGVSNVFYQVEAVSEFIQHQAGPLHILCPTTFQVRRQIHVHKVMVCSSQWLDVFYVEPMTRLVQQHLANNAATSIPSPSSTGGGLGAPDAILSSNVNNPHPVSMYRHCDHCEGYHVRCTCTHGCPSSSTSQCIPISSSIRSDTDNSNNNNNTPIRTYPCDQCGKRKILGRRYRCTTCTNPSYNLCKHCYNENTNNSNSSSTSSANQSMNHPHHDPTTHTFEIIDKIGSAPQPVSVTSTAVSATSSSSEESSSMDNDDEVRPDTMMSSSDSSRHPQGSDTAMTAATSSGNSSTQVSSRSSSRNSSRSDGSSGGGETTTTATSSNAAIGMVAGTSTSTFRPGQIIRLQNMTSLPQMNGQQGIVFEHIDDSRYLVHVPILNMMLSVQTMNMNPTYTNNQTQQYQHTYNY